jgi:hypothetical protein
LLEPAWAVILLLCFPHTWDDKHTPPYTAYWLRWSLTNFLPWLVWNSSPPNLHLLRLALQKWATAPGQSQPKFINGVTSGTTWWLK